MQTLDSPGCTGYWTSIDVDSQGYVHIVYRDETDNQLVHICQDGGGWQSEVVDACDCWFISMALDSEDQPRISYYEHTEGGIRYVYRDGSDWVTECVEPLSYTPGRYPRTDIELADDGTPHIVWYETDDLDLRYAVRTGGAWTLETVESSGDTGKNPSLSLDSSGNPHVAYWSPTGDAVRYAERVGGEWEVQTLAVNVWPNTTSYNTIVLDSQDRPHIAYNLSQMADGSIRYAWHDGSDWNTEVVIDWMYGYPGTPSGIVLDESGYPHISVNYNGMGYAIGSCCKDGSGWNYEFIQEQGCDDAVCIDGDGHLHMSYFDIAEEDLIYAYRGEEAVETDARHSVSGEISVDVLPNPCSSPCFARIRLDSPSWVTLEVYDASGRMVSEADRQLLQRGEHVLSLGEFPAGVYLCRVRTPEVRAVAEFVSLGR